LYLNAKPHEGFTFLLDIVQREKGGNYFIFTSNIDNQFQIAGFDSDKIYECHGSLSYLQYSDQDNDECLDSVWKLIPDQIPAIDSETLRVIDIKNIPRCRCGKVARPNVSMHGDTNFSWVETRSKKQKQLLFQWLETNKKSCTEEAPLVILEVGCGVSLHSISIESEILAEEYPKKN